MRIVLLRNARNAKGISCRHYPSIKTILKSRLLLVYRFAHVAFW
jgi:hypothetical protein